MGCSSVLSAQNADSLFYEGRKLAFAKSYDEAILIFERILNIDSGYHDAKLFIARIKAWKNNFEAAKRIMEEIPLAARNHEWLQLNVSILYWSQDRDSHLKAVIEARELYPDDEFFQLHEVYNSMMGNNLYEALQKLEKRSWESKEANRLRRQLAARLARNYISLGGQTDRLSTSGQNRWFSQLEGGYGRGASQYLGRIVFADRFNNQGLQYELEAYPVINERWYLFAGGSYSSSVLFPEFKAGLDVNYVPAHGFETSIGFRYLDFRDSRSWVLTPTGTWYTGDWMFHLRGGYVFRQDASNNASIALQTIRFYSSVWHRLRLTAGAGSFVPQRYSIDEPLQDISYWFGGEYRFPFYLSHFLWIGAELAWEQPEDGLDFLRRITLQLGYMYQF